MTKRFSASSAAQLMACPGSANLELTIPGYEEPVKDDMAGAKGVGTSVHELLEPATRWDTSQLFALHTVLHEYSQLQWRERRKIAEFPANLAQWLYFEWPQMNPVVYYTITAWFIKLAPHRLPPAMLKYMVEALIYVRDLRVERGVEESDGVHGELNMQAKWLKSMPFTTADVVIDSPEILDVLDYKTGKIPVEVIDNDQLMFYGATAYRFLQSKAPIIRLHILQPGSFLMHTVTRAELFEWMALAQRADQRIIDKDLTLRPNDHCTFCPANPHTRGDKATVKCPVMMEFLYPPVVDLDEVFTP